MSQSTADQHLTIKKLRSLQEELGLELDVVDDFAMMAMSDNNRPTTSETPSR
jgi:hypothetical protein